MIKPKLFLLNLTCEDNEENMHLYVFIGVACNEQEAFLKALDTIKKQSPELFEIATKKSSGLKVSSCDDLDLDRINLLFENYERNRQKDNLFSVNMFQIKDEKQDIMRKIIDKKDRDLFQKNISLFSEYEKMYIEDSI
jgi:hypothetical protein